MNRLSPNQARLLSGDIPTISIPALKENWGAVPATIVEERTNIDYDRTHS